MTDLDTRLHQAKHVLDSNTDRATARSVAFCLAYGASPTPLRLAHKSVNEEQANELFEKFRQLKFDEQRFGEQNETNSVK